MEQLLTTAKRWFTLKEAATYSAIGKHRLIALAREGRIKGFQDDSSGRHEWIFDRLSLDDFRESQSEQHMDYHKTALAIMKGVRL